MLCYINNTTDFNLTESKRVKYFVNNNYYTDTKYNNTFIFENDRIKLTLFFQPVIYGDDRAFNGLDVFRNTTSNSKIDNNGRGKTYTPDYIIKVEYGDKSDYLILDAKFSTPENIRRHQLQELVYKYLFSVSPLNKNDEILGLYILCGKKTGKDTVDIIHDLAVRMGRSIKPFAEILVVNGVNTEDYEMISEMIAIRNHVFKGGENASLILYLCCRFKALRVISRIYTEPVFIGFVIIFSAVEETHPGKLVQEVGDVGGAVIQFCSDHLYREDIISEELIESRKRIFLRLCQALVRKVNMLFYPIFLPVYTLYKA